MGCVSKIRSWIFRLVRSVKCYIGRHDFVVAQELSPIARRIGCKYCGGVWGMNDDVRCIIRWTPEFHRMYERVLKTPIIYKDWEFKKSH